MEFSGTLILAGLILALLWLWSMKNRRKYPLPPGPTGLPLIGNLLQVDKHVPFKSMLKLSEKYGPVMTLHLGWQRVVVLVGYDTVKEALVDQADDFVGRGPVALLLKVTKGYGLAISNGDRWRQLRRFTLTTLRDFGMGRKGMEEWIQEESQHLVTHIVISDLLRVLRVQTQSWLQMYNVFPWLMERLPGHQHTVFSQAEEVKKFIMTKIQEHMETINPSVPRDYIDCFLTRLSQEKDTPTSEFHYDNLVSTVLNLFLAGTETTSTTIRYALSVLIKYPNIQEKMQQEIDTVIGQERCPSMEDRKSLPFTDAVIHEVQRYLDIVPFSVPHYALQDICFRGYIIPKGTVILPMLHSVLREDKQWATPWSFNPQHFLDQNGNFKKNPAFLPFSAGKRACVGESLARMELFLFLVALLQRFTFSCPGGPDSVDLSPEYSSFANLPRRHQIIATPR
uniref:Cytochrome P450 2F5-like n=1 Tax=Myripristis murdjan TaxID=586833 RepID=A0A667YP19_9TELE